MWSHKPITESLNTFQNEWLKINGEKKKREWNWLICRKCRAKEEKKVWNDEMIKSNLIYLDEKKRIQFFFQHLSGWFHVKCRPNRQSRTHKNICHKSVEWHKIKICVDWIQFASMNFIWKAKWLTRDEKRQKKKLNGTLSDDSKCEFMKKMRFISNCTKAKKKYERKFTVKIILNVCVHEFPFFFVVFLRMKETLFKMCQLGHVNAKWLYNKRISSVTRKNEWKIYASRKYNVSLKKYNLSLSTMSQLLLCYFVLSIWWFFFSLSHMLFS